ncbi:MAG TPA: hypothetical protein VLJ14_16405 [Ktedonobacterales bacterium]|jgi:hypothetical protein|nr:hypothetical protein [Ktedonobacterales bacterium]
MRLDRVLSEGEAQVALRKMGFDVHEAEGRPGLYELAHPHLGGTRTVTVDQLVFLAEGAALADQLARGVMAE